MADSNPAAEQIRTFLDAWTYDEGADSVIAGGNADIPRLFASDLAQVLAERGQFEARAGQMRHIVDAQAHKLQGHIEQHAEDVKRIAELTAAVAVAAELLRRLSGPGPCRLDGDGACQAHEGFANGYLAPCPHPLGRQFAEAWRAVQAEGGV